jgi:hypothetical protein
LCNIDIPIESSLASCESCLGLDSVEVSINSRGLVVPRFGGHLENGK